MAMTRTTAAAIVLFAVSTATILGAWAFEILGGYAPCPLCLTERWPYYAVVALGFVLVVAATASAHERWIRAGLGICGAIMLASAALGGYHAGVEWGWWPGPQTCAGGGGFSGGGVLPDLDNARVVACDEAAWRLFGLSFAGYNAVISLCLAIVAFRGAIRPRRAV